MDPTSFRSELTVASSLAREAGRVILGHYSSTVKIEKKAGNEPVTEADRDANGLIVERLSRAFPRDAILAEETPPEQDRFRAERVWMVDPLDGTKEFIARNGEFAVMIGLAIGGRPALGVVYRPTVEALFWGIPGEGAWVTDPRGTRGLAVSDVADPARMRMAVSRSHRSPTFDKMKQALGIGEEVVSGSVGVKIGMVATRECDLYLHPSRGTKEWDTCAPEAILLAAGGEFTDVFGDAIAYNKPEVANLTGIVASNGRAHASIIRTIAPFCDLQRGLSGLGGRR